MHLLKIIQKLMEGGENALWIIFYSISKLTYFNFVVSWNITIYESGTLCPSSCLIYKYITCLVQYQVTATTHRPTPILYIEAANHTFLHMSWLSNEESYGYKEFFLPETVLKTSTSSSFYSVHTLSGFWPVMSESSYSESHGLNLAEQYCFTSR